MGTQIKNKRVLMLSLLAGALFMSGCGASKTGSGSSDLSSRAESVSSGMAACNVFSSTDATLDGKIKVYKSPSGVVSNDVVRVRISAIDSQFETNSRYMIRMFRWKAHSDGTTTMDMNPLEFTLQQSNSDAPISGYMKSLKMSDVNFIKNKFAISAANATEFFRKTDFMVFDVDITWDALKIVIYDTTNSSNPSVVAQADMLMPAFAANPVEYAADHPSVLNRLHPFWDDRSSNLDFARYSDSFCY